MLKGVADLTIETRSLPTLSRCYPCSFTFYVAHPISSIQRFNDLTFTKS
jgi:hypothetical protein